jgi:hypothetical protein
MEACRSPNARDETVGIPARWNSQYVLRDEGVTLSTLVINIPQLEQTLNRFILVGVLTG